MKNPRRNILIIIGILITVCLTVLIYFFINNPKVDDKLKEQTNVVDKISDYGYSLEDRDTELFKEKFGELKTLFESEEIDYLKYSELVSELYIIDLYTLDNKLNQYDVGGSEFVLESIRENYELKVKDTIYKYIEDNSNGKRTQKLPEVSDIEVINITESKYLYEETEYDSYEAELSWTYTEDLGYDKTMTVISIKIDDRLHIVEQK